MVLKIKSIFVPVIYFMLGVFVTAVLSLGVSTSDIAILNVPYSPSSPELMSPSDHVKESDIHVYQKRVVIDGEFEWARFTDTNSMDPIIDKGANALQKVPKKESDIGLGDIITYEMDGDFIIHRVIGIDEDEEGLYYTLKGDNNLVPDPYKVRFSDVRKVLVGIIY